MKNKVVTFDPSFAQFRTTILAIYELMINAVMELPKIESTLYQTSDNAIVESLKVAHNLYKENFLTIHFLL